MDFEKPNQRPNRKGKSSNLYLRKTLQSSKPSTLKISTHGFEKHQMTVAGETYTSGVEYSLNKGRRWELANEDFASSEDSVAFVRATHPSTARYVTASDSAIVFKRRINNDIPEIVDEEPQPKKTTKKDRKHFKSPKQTSPKPRPNAYSSDVYKAGKADVLVEVYDQAPLSTTRIPRVWRERDHEPRVHKTASITQYSM